MADPLLSTLCPVCNTNPPKYRCPRCASKTCSLACSKRHKLWSSCSGVRDPTVYKPRRELVTPAGIDHDYNFITGIERGMERRDKLVMEERRLLSRRDLRGRSRGGADINITRALERSGVMVERAPEGLRRHLDNSTSWGRHHKGLIWQVEWVRDDGSRMLGKIPDNQPIGPAYERLLEEHRRANMTDAERKQDKKRKAVELKTSKAKRQRLNASHHHLLMQKPALQDPESGAWNLFLPDETPEEMLDLLMVAASTESPVASATSKKSPPQSSLHLYLHRPHTPSSHPRVLVPLDPSATLQTLLQGRVVLEFPTIYVLSAPPAALPATFMLEHAFVQPPTSHRAWPRTAADDLDMIEDGEII